MIYFKIGYMSYLATNNPKWENFISIFGLFECWLNVMFRYAEYDNKKKK